VAKSKVVALNPGDVEHMITHLGGILWRQDSRSSCPLRQQSNTNTVMKSLVGPFSILPRISDTAIVSFGLTAIMTCPPSILPCAVMMSSLSHCWCGLKAFLIRFGICLLSVGKCFLFKRKAFA